LDLGAILKQHRVHFDHDADDHSNPHETPQKIRRDHPIEFTKGKSRRKEEVYKPEAGQMGNTVDEENVHSDTGISRHVEHVKRAFRSRGDEYDSPKEEETSIPIHQMTPPTSPHRSESSPRKIMPISALRRLSSFLSEPTASRRSSLIAEEDIGVQFAKNPSTPTSNCPNFTLSKIDKLCQTVIVAVNVENAKRIRRKPLAASLFSSNEEYMHQAIQTEAQEAPVISRPIFQDVFANPSMHARTASSATQPPRETPPEVKPSQTACATRITNPLEDAERSIISRVNVLEALNKLLNVFTEQYPHLMRQWKRNDLLYPLMGQDQYINSIIDVLAVLHENNNSVHSSSSDVNTELVSYILKSSSEKAALLAGVFMKKSTPSAQHLRAWRSILKSSMEEQVVFSNPDFVSCLLEWIRCADRVVIPTDCFSLYIPEAETWSERHDSMYPPEWIHPLLLQLKQHTDNSDESDSSLEDCFLMLLQKLAYQSTTLPLEQIFDVCQYVNEHHSSSHSVYSLSLLCQTSQSLDGLPTEYSKQVNALTSPFVLLTDNISDALIPSLHIIQHFKSSLLDSRDFQLTILALFQGFTNDLSHLTSLESSDENNTKLLIMLLLQHLNRVIPLILSDSSDSNTSDQSAKLSMLYSLLSDRTSSFLFHLVFTCIHRVSKGNTASVYWNFFTSLCEESTKLLASLTVRDRVCSDLVSSESLRIVADCLCQLTLFGDQSYYSCRIFHLHAMSTVFCRLMRSVPNTIMFPRNYMPRVAKVLAALGKVTDQHAGLHLIPRTSIFLLRSLHTFLVSQSNQYISENAAQYSAPMLVFSTILGANKPHYTQKDVISLQSLLVSILLMLHKSTDGHIFASTKQLDENWRSLAQATATHITAVVQIKKGNGQPTAGEIRLLRVFGHAHSDETGNPQDKDKPHHAGHISSEQTDQILSETETIANTLLKNSIRSDSPLQEMIDQNHALGKQIEERLGLCINICQNAFSEEMLREGNWQRATHALLSLMRTLPKITLWQNVQLDFLLSNLMQITAHILKISSTDDAAVLHTITSSVMSNSSSQAFTSILSIIHIILIRNGSLNLSKTSLTWLLRQLSVSSTSDRELQVDALVGILELSFSRNASLVESIFDSQTIDALATILQQTPDEKLHSLKQLIVSVPPSVEFTAALTEASIDIYGLFPNSEKLMQCTSMCDRENNRSCMLYSLLDMFFADLHERHLKRLSSLSRIDLMDNVHVKCISSAWNKTEISQSIQSNFQEATPELRKIICKMICSFASCLSVCVPKGESCSLFGILPVLLRALDNSQDISEQTQIVHAISAIVPLSETQEILSIALAAKGVIGKCVNLLISQYSTTLRQDNLRAANIPLLSSLHGLTYNIEEPDLRDLLVTSVQNRSKENLELSLVQPMIDNILPAARFQLELAVRTFLHHIQTNADDESLVMLERLLSLLRETLTSNLSTPEHVLLDIQSSKKTRNARLKPIIFSETLKFSNVTTEYSKNINQAWDRILPVKKIVFKGFEDVASGQEFFGLDSAHSKKFPRLKFVVSLLRSIQDDVFFSFSFISKKEIETIISLIHAFIDNFVQEEGEQISSFDHRVTTSLDILSTLYRRNSTLPFMKTKIFYLKTFSKYFREDTHRIISHLVDINRPKGQPSIYSTFFKRAPMLFDLKLKEAVFRKKLKAITKSDEKDVYEINRSHLLDSAFQAFMSRKKVDLKRPWKVKFEGEETIDIRGVRREFVSLLSHELFSSHSSLWKETEDHQFYPNPDATVQHDYLKYMEMTGRFLAKSLLEKELVDVRFCSFVLKKLLNRRLSYYDMRNVDKQLYENQILWIRDNDISEALDGLTFTITSNDGTEKELIPGGKRKKVTNDNKTDYLDLLVEYKLTKELDSHFHALLKGFSDIIPLKEIHIFNETEFELILCGKETIDVADLKRNVQLKFGYGENSETILNLWKVLRSFTQQERKDFLQFVTASPRVPAEGFRALDPPLTIQRIEETDKLPSSSTCFNLLKLPDVKSEEILNEKIRRVITEGLEGFAFS